jgi:hypothetical protein
MGLDETGLPGFFWHLLPAGLRIQVKIEDEKEDGQEKTIRAIDCDSLFLLLRGTVHAAFHSCRFLAYVLQRGAASLRSGRRPRFFSGTFKGIWLGVLP